MAATIPIETESGTYAGPDHPHPQNGYAHYERPDR